MRAPACSLTCSAFCSRDGVRVRLALGEAVIHLYFTLPLSYSPSLIASLPEYLGDTAGLLVQLAWLLCLPVAFQLTVGIAFHKLLLLEVKLLLAASSSSLAVLSSLYERCRDVTAQAQADRREKQREFVTATRSSAAASSSLTVPVSLELVSTTLQPAGLEESIQYSIL